MLHRYLDHAVRSCLDTRYEGNVADMNMMANWMNVGHEGFHPIGTGKGDMRSTF